MSVNMCYFTSVYPGLRTTDGGLGLMWDKNNNNHALSLEISRLIAQIRMYTLTQLICYN